MGILGRTNWVRLFLFITWRNKTTKCTLSVANYKNWKQKKKNEGKTEGDAEEDENGDKQIVDYGTMITIQDLYNIVGNKIANEVQKALIRNNFPPQIAEQMCNAIDGQERAEHFQRLLKEYNEWMQNQQRQQEAVARFLREYYK